MEMGCNSIQDNYPDEVKEKKMESQFDVAKYELYKLWHYCIEFGEGFETLADIPAEQDLVFLGLEEVDSMYGIIFEFKNSENLDFLDKCTKYNGIGFNQNSIKAELIFIQDGVYIDGRRINNNSKYDAFEKIFLNYLNENKSRINPWLRNYVSSRID